jgi:hypothetical protein
MISSGLCHSVLHMPAQSPLGRTLKACQAGDPQALHNLHSARPCPPSLHRPAHYSFPKSVPLRPAKLGTHTCTISMPLNHAPKPVTRDSNTCRISTLPACAIQACQAHAPKAHYFTSAKGLHPQARKTPHIGHLPQEGSKPT